MDDQAPAENAEASTKAHRPWRRRVVWLLLAIAGLIVVGDLVLQRLIEVPPPSGASAVAQATLVFKDDQRVDPWTAERPRELVAYLFYPTAEPGRRTSYFPNLWKLAGNFAWVESVLIRLLPHFVGSHASEDAPPDAEKPLPVILFSAGAGSPVFVYRTLLEDLASHGYLVVAVEPTYEGAGQVFPDGRVFKPLARAFEPSPDDSAAFADFYRRRVEARVEDLSFVLDRLAELAQSDSAWQGKIDAARVGAFGHSLGGVAVSEAARHDQRIAAVVNLDGMLQSYPCLPDDQPEGSGAALLYLGQTHEEPSDAMLEKMKVDRAAYGVRSQNRRQQRASDLARIYDSVVWTELDDAEHSDFSDAPFFYPRTGSGDDDPATRRLDRIRRDLRAHFDERLRAPAGE